MEKKKLKTLSHTNTQKRTSGTHTLQCLVIRFPDYKPYPGFYDLREYNLTVKMFKKLWRTQDMLYHMSARKDYYKKWHPAQWEKAKEVSACYQQMLFKYVV